MSRDPHTLAGAYALHAVDDPAERAGFEEHLGRCEECAEEARELREAVARLGAAVAVEPPPGLRARVMTEIALVRQVPPVTAPVPAVPGGGHAGTSETGYAGGSAARGGGRRSRRAPRRPWWPRAVTGLAAACLAAAVGLGIVTVRERDALDRERAGGRAIAAVLAAPDARTVTGKAGRGVSAKVVVSRSQGRMVFLSSGLAAPPEGKIYQLWRIGPGGAVPDEVTRPDAAGRTPPVLLGRVGDATKVAVTVEPAGGSKQPSTTPFLVMKLPAT
ncbi:anti-sigma factor [Sphaerisporangium fuscum]|uniref:anti-sigma factor n=1 Tax=Sphaerisporangium fuscum TaxID=2835868 RepID=UPI001BDDBD89|nr:anti-sigma factor [Sphaerisporangium fuscum]